MTGAWFSSETAPYLAFFSLLATAAALEPLAKQGRARALVLGIYGACTALGIALIIAAGVAILVNQPRFVWVPLAFVGVVVTLPFVFGFKEMQRVYREAELRKTVASDL